ncbi:MAG: response regulator transcription factor [Saprospiraceae bacterium]|nr:response regulator transcription factor [Saprospiraceae bacterium]
MKKYSVIIADDHPIFRNGVKEVLSEIKTLELLGEAKDGAEAYSLILAHRPELAILDLEMPVLSGLDVCNKVLSEKNQTRFIVLTMHKEKHFFNAAMEAGVSGYLLKDNAILDLIQCIEAVCAGKIYVSPAIEHFLTEHTASNQSVAVQRVKKLLSPTEKIILKLISEGKSSADIASLLFISVHTVDNHRSNIARKLELEGKNSLMKFAMQHLGGKW